MFSGWQCNLQSEVFFVGCGRDFPRALPGLRGGGEPMPLSLMRSNLRFQRYFFKKRTT